LVKPVPAEPRAAPAAALALALEEEVVVVEDVEELEEDWELAGGTTGGDMAPRIRHKTSSVKTAMNE
jgi:hypothetical protein